MPVHPPKVPQHLSEHALDLRPPQTIINSLPPHLLLPRDRQQPPAHLRLGLCLPQRIIRSLHPLVPALQGDVRRRVLVPNALHLAKARVCDHADLLPDGEVNAPELPELVVEEREALLRRPESPREVRQRVPRRDGVHVPDVEDLVLEEDVVWALGVVHIPDLDPIGAEVSGDLDDGLLEVHRVLALRDAELHAHLDRVQMAAALVVVPARVRRVEAVHPRVAPVRQRDVPREDARLHRARALGRARDAREGELRDGHVRHGAHLLGEARAGRHPAHRDHGVVLAVGVVGVHRERERPTEVGDPAVGVGIEVRREGCPEVRGRLLPHVDGHAVHLRRHRAAPDGARDGAHARWALRDRVEAHGVHALLPRDGGPRDRHVGLQGRAQAQLPARAAHAPSRASRRPHARARLIGVGAHARARGR
mmetsp:Transcript_3266/g.8207  ORF Transcript_3266/g.8207 Transcript_3266/m.8207 type:complete len:422 (+) Transcript_3266:206-1471(+)